jgi:PAS domain S-box-containing protein
MDALPAAIYTCDADGRVTMFNEAAVELWGRRPELGKDFWCGSWKIFNKDGTPLPLEQCPMAETLKTGKAVRGKEIIIERPNGDRFNILPHPRPLFDEKGLLTGAINMLIDVTYQTRYIEEAKRSEDLMKLVEALQTSEQRYHRMVAEVQDYAIILLSEDGTIENWNKGAEHIKGYSESEVVGKKFTIFYTKEDQENRLPERLINLARREGRANNEGWRVRKDGSKFWGSISITAIHDDLGNVTGFSKVTRDLTERKQSEEKAEFYNQELRKKNELLQVSEERYHRMVAEVEDYAILMLDVDGKIQNWNRGAQRIKGYTAAEAIGKHFRIFYTDKDRNDKFPERFLSEAAEKGKALHEGWRQRKDGTKFWGSVVLTALHNPQGEVIGFSKVTRDLTERKLAEENLMASARILQQKNKELEKMNEELSSFAYISSHDLQEPLRKIQTFSDRIMELEHKNLSEKGRDLLQRMHQGALRMQTLIRDILAYSRTNTSDKVFELTNLNDLVAQSKQELEVLISEKNATIISDNLPVMKVIPFQMQQLFTNLLNNALKFSKHGIPPKVVIGYNLVGGEAVQPPAPDLAKQYHHFSVQDNGIGFEPLYARKIFEVFQRLHGRSEFGGTGIGLAICKKIVENHNGVIRGDAQINEGATFHVYLPVMA